MAHVQPGKIDGLRFAIDNFEVCGSPWLLRRQKNIIDPLIRRRILLEVPKTCQSNVVLGSVVIGFLCVPSFGGLNLLGRQL